MEQLTFSEIAKLGGRKEKGGRVLSEKLAANFERTKSFPTLVEAGEDDCTGQVHKSRFLRGYVGNSQDLWTQGRRVLGLSGLPPISNYETVTMGLNGFVSARVWHEVHNPSSKVLSIRMLAPESMKQSWNTQDKLGEVKDFSSMSELKMAMVVLDVCIRKVMPWNHAMSTLAIFMHTIEFGEVDLSNHNEKLSFLADFIDEVIRHNAQAWDEERHFMPAMELATKWSTALLRKLGGTARKSGGTKQEKASPGKQKQAPAKKKNEGDRGDRAPPGVCKKFNQGECTHPGDKHSASWDPEYILRHVCSQYILAKKRYCMGNHAKGAHPK